MVLALLVQLSTAFAADDAATREVRRDAREWMRAPSASWDDWLAMQQRVAATLPRPFGALSSAQRGNLLLLGQLYEDRVASAWAGLSLVRALDDARIPLAEADIDWVAAHVPPDALLADHATMLSMLGPCTAAKAAYTLVAAECTSGRDCRVAEAGLARLGPDAPMSMSHARDTVLMVIAFGQPQGLCGSASRGSAESARLFGPARAALRELRSSECVDARDW